MKKILLLAILVFAVSFSCKKKEAKKDTVNIQSSQNKKDSVSDSHHEEEYIPEKSDLDYEIVSEKDFKNWKGEYFLDYIDYAGEDDGTKLKARLVLDTPEDGHFYLWYETPNDTVKLGMHHVYGSFGKGDDANTIIKFLPEVISEGEDTGIDLDYFLYNKGRNFYIKSRMIPSENGHEAEIPIKKIK